MMTLQVIFDEILQRANGMVNFTAEIYNILDALTTAIGDSLSSASTSLALFPPPEIINNFLSKCIIESIDNTFTVPALKMFCKLLSSSIELCNEKLILRQIIKFAKSTHNQVDCSIVTSNAVILTFVEALKQDRTSQWVIQHKNDISDMVWKEIKMQRSIYLTQACREFYSELIIVLTRTAPADATPIMETLWNAVQDLSWETKTTLLTQDSFPCVCLYILKDVCIKETLVGDVLGIKNQLESLINMLAVPSLSTAATGIIISYMSATPCTSTFVLLSNKLNLLAKNKDTFLTVHKAALSFIISFPVKSGLLSNLEDFVMSPLFMLLETLNNSVSPEPNIVPPSKSLIVLSTRQLFEAALQSSELSRNISDHILPILTSIIKDHLSISLTCAFHTNILIILFQFLNNTTEPLNVQDLEKHKILACVMEISEIVDIPLSVLSLVCRFFKIYFIDIINSSDMTELPIDQCLETRLAKWVLIRLCDREWEIKDSVLELLAAVAPLFENSKVHEWTVEHSIVPNVYKMLSDREPYVKAAVLKTLSAFFQYKPEDVIKAAHTISYLLTEVVLILEDEDNLSRREAVQFLHHILTYDVSSLDLESTYHALYQTTTQDSDWEVKRLCLYFWSKYVENFTQTSVISSTDDNLSEKLTLLLPTRALHSLTAALTDCDPSVANLASQLLSNFSKQFYPNICQLKSNFNELSSSDKTSIVDVYGEVCHSEPESFTVEMFVGVLQCLHYLTYLDAETDNKIFLKSRLADILLQLKSSTVLPECISEQDDDIILDCY